jgi:hypothetical protein
MEDYKKIATELYSYFHTPLIKYRDGLNILELQKMQECAKECALVLVNSHIEELSKMKLIFSDRELHLKKWESVKEELQKL